LGFLRRLAEGNRALVVVLDGEVDLVVEGVEFAAGLRDLLGASEGCRRRGRGRRGVRGQRGERKKASKY
jgi:hypothetical protein